MALITPLEVKTNTSMGGNVDPDKFIHLIYDIEVMVLENVLGTALIDKIRTDFNEGGTNNLAGDYLELFNDYIKPMLWHSVYSEYLRDGNVIAANGGVFTHSPEDGQTVNIDSLKYVSKNAQSKADVYIDRLDKYLCSKSIAEYQDPQTNDYDLNPDKNISTIGGWFFGTGTAERRRGLPGGSGDYLELD